MDKTLRKRLIILLFAPLLLCGCKEEKLHIHGNIVNLPDDVVYLKVFEGVPRTIEATTSVNGVFEFELPQIIPNILFLQINALEGYYLPVVVDGEEIFITGNFLYPKDIVVEGSKSNDELTEYRKSIEGHELMLFAIEQRKITLEPGDPEMKYLLNKEDSIMRVVTDIRHEFIVRYPESIVSAFLGSTMVADSASARDIQNIIDLFGEKMPDNAYLRKMKRRRDAAKQ